MRSTKDKKQAVAALGGLLELAAKPEFESLLVAALPQARGRVGGRAVGVTFGRWVGMGAACSWVVGEAERFGSPESAALS